MLKDIRKNPLVLTDSYNLSHQRLKINTDYEVSHMYNRKEGQILYGFHELVTDFLGNIRVTHPMVDEAVAVAKRANLKFPQELWRNVVDECNGIIPLKVETLPEGTYCPAGTPFSQVSNTVDGYGELVTWWEGVLMHGYFPSGCATEALKMRRYLEEKQAQYKYDDSFLWRFHSFGFRGHASLENSYWAGTAWALFLHGTDDFHAGYHLPSANLGSIPALAHKVTQQFDDEFEGFTHAIEATANAGEKVVALVIDTYDAYNVINNYIVKLSHLAFDKGVHIVLRPDSGDTWRQVVDIYDVVKENSLPNVSAIIGEGMSFEEAKKADIFFEKNNVPLNFVSYGIGAGFYKHIERDTYGWAMKTAYSNKKPRMKFSENPMKRSIPGIVNVYRNDDGELVVDEANKISSGMYRTIYEGDRTKQIVVPTPSFTLTQKRAMNQATSQLYIKTSQTIKDMIVEFKKTYKSR